MKTTGDTDYRFSLLLKELQQMRADVLIGSVGLVLLRLSGLRQINEAFGYAAGDHVLEEARRRLQRPVWRMAATNCWPNVSEPCR